VTRLSEVAASIKSANAGASQITMDVAFADETTFERVARSGLLNAEVIARIYRVDPGAVEIHHYRPAHTIKVTMPRAVLSGGIEENDFDGVQQYIPLLDLEVPAG
jgi:Domain of unknown function (DUF4387)